MKSQLPQYTEQMMPMSLLIISGALVALYKDEHSFDRIPQFIVDEMQRDF